MLCKERGAVGRLGIRLRMEILILVDRHKLG